jgi:diguanylate cyclase (GGDEF)-like protein
MLSGRQRYPYTKTISMYRELSQMQHERLGAHVRGVTGHLLDDVFRGVDAFPSTESRRGQYDKLTGLPNRRLFRHRLTEAIAVAKRGRRRVAVLFVDLDRCTHINESWGHASGDRLLQSVAQRLLANVRGCDVVSRHGENEFAILCAPVTYAQDTVVAERLLLALRELHRIDGLDRYVTATIGLATYPDDGEDADALLQQARSAMACVEPEAIRMLAQTGACRATNTNAALREPAQA